MHKSVVGSIYVYHKAVTPIPLFLKIAMALFFRLTREFRERVARA
jgi:hypothetical protein